MKKLLPPFLTLTICICAADFWQSKPFTDWNDKEIQRVETNSPWAKQVSVSMGEGGGTGGRSGRGGRGGGGDSDSTTGGGGRGAQQVGDISGGGASALTLIVSWRTSLPVREALAKEKFGAEAGTSPDAKKLLEAEQKFYGILIAGLPARMLRTGDKMKDALLLNTTLSAKGKDPVQASDIQTGGSEQKALVLFLFPKTTPFDIDDKEVEFSTKLGPLVVKQKFRLKDMVFNGKLEL